jgi:hypothetical protein
MSAPVEQQQQQQPVPAAPAAAPAQGAGPIDHNDMNDWMNRFNEVLSKSGEHINQKSPEDSREWHSSFFGCFDPIDLCTCFGLTHAFSNQTDPL